MTARYCCPTAKWETFEAEAAYFNCSLTDCQTLGEWHDGCPLDQRRSNAWSRPRESLMRLALWSSDLRKRLTTAALRGALAVTVTVATFAQPASRPERATKLGHDKRRPKRKSRLKDLDTL